MKKNHDWFCRFFLYSAAALLMMTMIAIMLNLRYELHFLSPPQLRLTMMMEQIMFQLQQGLEKLFLHSVWCALSFF